MRDFNLEKTFNQINEYLKTFDGKVSMPNKVFYYPNEWEGWRFYLKALRHRDFKSIWGHLLSKGRE